MLVFCTIITLTSGFVPNLAIIAMAQTENVEDNYKETVLKNNQENEDFVYIDLATHDFADMHLAIPQQQQERIILKTKLLKIAGSKLFNLKIGSTVIAPFKANVATQFVAKNFTPAKTTVAGRSINFSRHQMAYVLHRHHQNYWAGQAKNIDDAPTLFAKSATPNAIRDVAFQVLRANPNRVKQIGNGGGGVNATINKQPFRVYINKGEIISVYPLK